MMMLAAIVVCFCLFISSVVAGVIMSKKKSSSSSSQDPTSSSSQYPTSSSTFAPPPPSMTSSQRVLSVSSFGAEPRPIQVGDGVPTDQAQNEYCEARGNYFKTLYNNDTSWKEMCPTTGWCEVSSDKCVVRPPYVTPFSDILSNNVTRYQNDSLTPYNKYVTDYNSIKASIQSYKASNIGKENTTEYQRVLDIEKSLDNTYTIRTTRTTEYTIEQNAVYCRDTYPETSNDSTPCRNDPRCKVIQYTMGSELVDRCKPI